MLNNKGKLFLSLMLVIGILFSGTCFMIRRFPKTSDIIKVKVVKPKVQKKEIKLPEIPKKKNLKLKPWKKENPIYYTLEDDDIQLLCLGEM